MHVRSAPNDSRLHGTSYTHEHSVIGVAMDICDIVVLVTEDPWACCDDHSNSFLNPADVYDTEELADKARPPTPHTCKTKREHEMDEFYRSCDNYNNLFLRDIKTSIAMVNLFSVPTAISDDALQPPETIND